MKMQSGRVARGFFVQIILGKIIVFKSLA